MYLVTNRISSPECAALLKDRFNAQYYAPVDSTEEYIFGYVKQREEESIWDYCSYKDILDEYVKLDIKKYYGLTLKDYLDLTTIERSMIVERTAIYIAEYNKAAAAATMDINKAARDMNIDIEGIGDGY